MTILCRCHWNQWEVKAFVQRETGAFSSKVLRSWSGFVWKLSSNSSICSSLFSSSLSLASCAAFKTKLWNFFKHLIWHQGKNSSADGRETVRKKVFFFFWTENIIKAWTWCDAPCYSACFLLWDDKRGVGGEDGVSANSIKLCWLSEVSDVYVSRSIWIFASCQIIF